MLKLAATRSAGSACLQRWSKRGFVTAAQKRALNKDQLKGGSTEAAPPAPPAAALNPPGTVAPKDGGIAPLAIAGLLGAGVIAADQFDLLNPVRDAIGMSKEAKKETKKDSVAPSAPKKDFGGVPMDDLTKLGFGGPFRNSADSCVRGPSHPTDGSRVRGMDKILKPEEKKKDEKKDGPEPDKAKDIEVDPPASLEKALKELNVSVEVDHGRAPSPAAADGASSKHLDKLDQLSVQELRQRLINLTSEVGNMMHYEAVRLAHLDAQWQQRMQQEVSERLHEQKLLWQDQLAKKLREAADQANYELRHALDRKEDEVSQLLESAKLSLQSEHETELQHEMELQSKEFQSQFETELGKQVAVIKEQFGTELKQYVDTLQALEQRLEHLQRVHTVSSSYEKSSRLAHHISAGILNLVHKLEQAQPVAQDLPALRALLQDEPVLMAALDQLPLAVSEGRVVVPTASGLQSQFANGLYQEARIAAQVPGPSLGAQLFGRVFATLTIPPKVTTAGSPPTTTLEEDGAPMSYWQQTQHSERVLAQIKRLMEEGQLEAVVALIDSQLAPTVTTKQLQFVLKDWKQAVQYRIDVDRVLHVLQLETTVLNERMKNA